MTVTIFGATGTVGLVLIKQALFLNYKVKAYGRNVHELIELSEQHENLSLIKGGVFDKSDVTAAIKGSDFVISALGGATDGSDNSRSLGIKYIVEGMEDKGVKRIVAIGGIGVLQSDDDTLLMETENFPEQFIPVSQEHKKAWQYLAASSLDWTFVCPPLIIDGEVTGEYGTKADYPERFPASVKSGNLAQFMLHEAINNNYCCKRVGIADRV